MLDSKKTSEKWKVIPDCLNVNHHFSRSFWRVAKQRQRIVDSLKRTQGSKDCLDCSSVEDSERIRDLIPSGYSQHSCYCWGTEDEVPRDTAHCFLCHCGNSFVHKVICSAKIGAIIGILLTLLVFCLQDSYAQNNGEEQACD